MLVILSLLTMALILVIDNHQEQKQIAEKEASLNNGFYPIELPVDAHSNKEYRKQVAILSTASRRTKINYLKRQVYISYRMVDNHLDYSFPVQRIYFQVYAVRPSRIWQNFKEKVKLVNTRTGNLGPKIKGNIIEVMPIGATLNDYHYREGTYYLETSNQAKIKEFISILSQEMGKQYHTKYRNSEFKNDGQEIAEPSFDDPDELDDLLKITLIFLVVFIFVYQLSNSQELAIYRLNGLSPYRSFDLSLGKVWIVSLLATMLLDFWGYYLQKWSLSCETLIKQLTILLSIPIISLAIIGILQELSFTNQLHRKNYTKFNFIILYAVKAWLIISAFASVNPLIKLGMDTARGLTPYYDGETLVKGMADQNKYAIFYPMTLGNNPLIDSFDQLAALDKAIYEPLNKKRALLINLSNLYQPNSVDPATKYAIVNPNYLKHYPLYDRQGKRISVSNCEKKIILCIPKNLAKYQKAFAKTVQSSDKYGLGYSRPIKVVITDPDKSHNFKSIDTGSNLADQLISVTTSQNNGFNERSIMTGGGLEESLKVRIHGSVKKTYETIKPLLIRNNYYDNYPQLIKLSDVYREDLKMTEGNVVVKWVTISFGLLTTLVLICYVTILFFKINHRSIAIKRVNGYSKLLAYRSFWLLALLQYLVMIGIVFYSQSADQYLIAFLLGEAITELSVNLTIIAYLEKHKMGDALDGE